MRRIVNNVSKTITKEVPASPNQITRNYANYELNQPDNASLDPNANTNNPPIGKKGMRHPELHRTRCDIPGVLEELVSAYVDLPQIVKLLRMQHMEHLPHMKQIKRPCQL